ncbi:MAG: TonB-dependent receptor [Acidobacteria bacterium]|nr:TonB-dependent receptor [Acidobacteriota bacterium]
MPFERSKPVTCQSARRAGLWAVSLLLLCPASAMGQSPSGSIRVVVSGLDGAPIPGATVMLADSGSATKLIAYTDDAGICVFTQLAPGTYGVEGDLTGFTKAVLGSVVVQAGSTRRVDLTLRLQPGLAGDDGESKRPVPGAPSIKGPLSERESAGRRSAEPVLSGSGSTATPAASEGRRREGPGGGTAQARMRQLQEAFQNLSLLPPETSDATQQSIEGIFGAAMVSGNSVDSSLQVPSGGSEAIAGPLLLSGSINTGMPEVSTFGFRGGVFGGEFMGDRPEYGQGQAVVLQRGGTGGFGGPGMPGSGPAGMPGMIPGSGFPGGGGLRGGRGGPFGRAGANRIRGAVALNYRDSIFDARPYSLTGQEIEKNPYSNADFNLMLGGPLKILRLFDAGNKTFFFVNYGGSRGGTTQDTTTTVPTLAERAGNFAQSTVRGLPVRIFDPAATVPGGAREAFPGNTIPDSRIDPIARGLLAYIPPPNLLGSVNNFHLEQSLDNVSDRLMTRIDRRLTNKDNLNGSYFFLRQGSEQGQAFPDLLSTTSVRNQSLNLEYTHTFKSTLINVLRATFNRTRVRLSNLFAFTDDVEGRLGIGGVSSDPVNYGVPTLAFTNFGSLNLSYPRLARNQTTGLTDHLTWVRKAHTLTAGVDVRRIQLNTIADVNARGSFTFSGLLTSDFDALGNPVPDSGFDWADFLLGLPQATSIRFGGSDTYFRYTVFNGFVQDTWKARNNLTLTLGLRYELATPPHEKYDRMANLDIKTGFSDAAVALPEQAGPFSGVFPRALVETDRNNFAPRIGLAYRPSKSTRTTIRAGYGLFYNPSVYNQFVSQLASQPPFAVAQNPLTGPTTPLTLANGFPPDPNVAIRNTYAIDRFYRIGYAQNWNVTVQQQISRTWVLEFGYVGGKGTGLDLLLAPNRAPLGSSPLDTEGSRRISNAQGFLYQTSGASSTLHSFQARLNKRFSGGFNLNFFYTYAKSIDSASNIGGGSQIVVQDDTDFDAERSLSSFDVRHRLQANFNYELPFGPRQRYAVSGWKSRLMEGWNLQGSMTLASGTPLSPRILGNVINNSGTGANQSERPDATGISPHSADGTVSRFFNTEAFVLPRPGAFGNAGRNTISGPGTVLVNASIGRRLMLGGEGRSLEVRWQGHNILNIRNFAGVNTTVNSTPFGTVTSARQMRRMEFVLRYRF